ncbi:MAG: DUF1573 domain-containing protein [Cytophagales bacterium]|nr:DUF1573 domain-containing protein [Cytophagales bacterium]
MNKEKQEQLKIALLGIIAVVLIIQTGVIMTSKKSADIGRGTGISTQMQGGQKPVTPGEQSVTVPIDLGQQSATVPLNVGQQQASTTTMIFEQTDVDLGTLNAGTKKSHTFKFTNTGNLPLMLSNVTADAGASVVSWPTEPIPQGGTGEITVELGGDNPAGFQQKIIHVSANTEPAHRHLTIKANVK